MDTIQIVGTTNFQAVQEGADTLIVAGEETLAILAGYSGEVIFAA